MKRQSLVLAILMLLAVLCGCGRTPQGTEINPSMESQPVSDPTAPTEAVYIPRYDWESENHPVDMERTGVERYGVRSNGNGFECTDDGVYFLCILDGGGSYLLYGDHGSDTLVKLCGRPDCDHTGRDCNARFALNSCSVCYYDGYLYCVNNAINSEQLVRTDLDGSNRVVVLDTRNVLEGSTGSFTPSVWNGVFTIGLKRVNSSGMQEIIPYYYKLDGSMEQMEQIGYPTMCLSFSNDGGNYLTMEPNGENNDIHLWDIESNTGTYLTTMVHMGYYGTEEAYYVEDGIIYRHTYADDKREALLDTGLEGEWMLHGFPDCVVLSQVESEQDPETGYYETHTMYFYNWDFESLGSVTLDFPRKGPQYNLICGETPDRIILTDNVFTIPHYYIEKSDFGTGNIQVHEYNMPDVDWEKLLG